VDGSREPPVSVDRARKLIAVSPNSPFAMARLMEDAWDQAEPKLEEWRKVVGDHPTFLGGLARHLVKADQADEAEKTLERYIKVSADKWAYEELAKLYLRRGDGKRWKATLDEFLAKGEDYGLDHAEVRVAIANELMKVGKYAEARPYADAAAQTWAGWAMSCAQWCAEAQRDWEAAEAYARASSERYPGSMWAVWFLFCERNGQGDIASARGWTKAMCDALLQSPALPDDTLLLVAYVELLCGETEKAREALRRFPVETEDPVYLASLAATADLAGLAEPRDAAVRRFCEKFRGTAPKSTEVLRMIQ
jgi:tetratricopeptide (TPR) repeat protein